MTTFEYTIQDELGIHARPAGILVKEASKFASNIELSKGDKRVSAKKIFGVMGLGAKTGETITVYADGEDEAQAIEALKQLLQTNL